MKKTSFAMCLLLFCKLTVAQNCIGGFINYYNITCDTISSFVFCDTVWNNATLSTGDGGNAHLASCSACGILTTDYSGNTYVEDQVTGSTIIRKINSSGIITKFAGCDTCSTYTEGGAAIDQYLVYPGFLTGLSGNSLGSIFYSVHTNPGGYPSHQKIHKIHSGVINTIAGCDTCTSLYFGFTPALDWKFSTIGGIFGLANDGVLVCDIDGASSLVNFLTSSGITYSGSGGGFVGYIATDGIMYIVAGGQAPIYPFGDGDTAIAYDGYPNAYLNQPSFVTQDFNRNIYIIDGSVIRKIDSNGIITKFAGSYASLGYDQTGYSGDGGPANSCLLNNPTSIVFDPAGNAYVVDQGNNAIRKIDPSGVITNYISCISCNPSSFNKYYNCPSDSFYLSHPYSATINFTAGNQLVFDDHSMYAVFTTMSCIPTSVSNVTSGSAISISPNPTSGAVNIKYPANIEKLQIINLLGQVILTANPSICNYTADLSGFSDGIYLVKINNTFVSRLIKQNQLR
jgi:Secretion system C-terminal sorting domain